LIIHKNRQKKDRLSEPVTVLFKKQYRCMKRGICKAIYTVCRLLQYELKFPS